MFEQWIPLLVAIFGGVGIKGLEILITKSGKKIDMEAEIRKELREVVSQQDEKISALSDEIDKWKKKYYESIEKLLGYEQLKLTHATLKIELDKLNTKAKALPDKQ